ncbi:hypothetical protein [Marinirhabdus gelatinilytica]|uniref:Four helix bundle protein n=1 Tax=Marinirhabdus gelatinilytica TaxID=1703343 RepID=A0A370Q626_9FLAO|nr:hypothetical protein [Marinirhabdus gelatinilytica]RDK83811.1 hypothetical protein C8D94_10624 [Marinirhabdus gelatinilytica]
MSKKYDLDSRLEDYAASVILVYDKSPKTFASDYLAKQLIRSVCSSALNFERRWEQVRQKIKLISLEYV